LISGVAVAKYKRILFFDELLDSVPER